MPHLGSAIVLGLVAVMVFRPISPYSATAAFLVLLVTLLVLGTLKAAQIEAGVRNRRTERRRLLGDCEHQHELLLQGYDNLATYGRFQSSCGLINPPRTEGQAWEDWRQESELPR